MPYVDKGSHICKAEYNLDIKSNDIIITYPALLKVNKNLIIYPPLSKISDECKDEIESPSWVDGYVVKGNERLEIITENLITVKGEIDVDCSKVLTAYTLKKILGEVKLQISNVTTKGYPILSINRYTLISLYKDSVVIYTPTVIPIIKTFAYSVFYYIKSSSEEE
ncbi:hypothetical protein EWF20_08620 [Sulfolobus sp. S-194]|uniref:hypothetical protein n=1 Tax=Sulfolobus sp. S-194 TaxID=2512240 RepID=UPI001436DAD6|nr:hypothetical protein [Sulfolobus sp. S-194]QIW24200.1 hypothetical protein EWF20_08620 [Sulfolobus sp. S-194]